MTTTMQAIGVYATVNAHVAESQSSHDMTSVTADPRLVHAFMTNAMQAELVWCNSQCSCGFITQQQHEGTVFATQLVYIHDHCNACYVCL